MYDAVPGTVLEVFIDGSVLVQARDQAYYIRDHELPETISKGDILS